MYINNYLNDSVTKALYHPVMRALVTYSNPLNGEIKVKIPAVTGADHELSISYIGRSDNQGYWVVPEPNTQIIVSADDVNMTNLFWIQSSPYNPGTGEPTGFENRDDSTINFSNATRTFTISPVASSYDVYVRGNKFSIDEIRSVVIPNVTGTYYFYFDVTGTLQYSTVFGDIEWTAPVSMVYWRAVSSSALIFADERHGTVMDWQTHEYLHRTRGAAYASGFGISNYTTNGTGSASAGLTFDIANGTFFDEDIEVTITHSATPVANTWQQRLQNGAYIPVFYNNSNGWEKDTATQFPVKLGAAHPYYNSGSTLVEMGNNRYGVSWIVATNGLNEPIICIMGQAEYSNIGDAAGAAWGSLSVTDLPVFEFRPLWKIIFQAQTGTYQAAIRDVVDLRTSITNVTTTGAGITTLDGLTDVVLSNPVSGDALSYNGTNWTNQVVSLVPTASVIPYAGSAAPSGWLLCNGQAISRSANASLFSAIGTTYGAGNGSTTFNVPDLRGRAVAGIDNMGGTDAGRLSWANTLGTVGGAETHTLTTTEMPSHDHDVHRNSGVTAGSTGAGGPTVYNILQNSGTSWGRTQLAGSGGAHNNMQPTMLLNYIIKT